MRVISKAVQCKLHWTVAVMVSSFQAKTDGSTRHQSEMRFSGILAGTGKCQDSTNELEQPCQKQKYDLGIYCRCPKRLQFGRASRRKELKTGMTCSHVGQAVPRLTPTPTNPRVDSFMARAGRLRMRNGSSLGCFQPLGDFR